MKTQIKYYLLIILVFGVQLISNAQCAMCSATAESSIDSGSTAASGLNSGVLYLLLMPISFGAVLFFLYWKSKKHAEQYADIEV